MPYLSDAALRKVMHQSGYTKSGNARKPKAQRRKYAARPRAGPSPASAAAFRKVAGEKKGMDTDIQNAAVTATTTGSTDILPLNLIRAGSGSMNRVGRKVFCKSIRIKGVAQLTLGPTATTLNRFGNVLRIALIWDKQPSGALPVFSDIFADTPQGGTDASTVLSFPRYDNMSRFQILRDFTIHANSSVAITGGTQNIEEIQVPFDEYVKLGNRQTIYGADSSPAVIGDISSGGLYISYTAIYDTASVTRWSIDDTSFARLRYSD